MTHQPEYALELELIKQLQGLGYQLVTIDSEQALRDNLKRQLELHNQTTYTDSEYKQILNYLARGNIYEKAHALRDKLELRTDDNKVKYVEFLNCTEWCKNQFQVTHQVEQTGKYKNRYDVTILINGLPLCHIELKRRGIELKEAFNQISRYQRHSFFANDGLFLFPQIFIISNGVNTKYYANNRNTSYEQTFYWSDFENNLITDLEHFTQIFLEPCHLAKMITRYIVLQSTDKCLMVLRPYQYYAVEAIVEQVKNNPRKNGYIWHTTGSGKTLTSFKTSQLLINIPKVDKVIFVVDRKDLDYQTIKEFNHFAKDSVTEVNNTMSLVSQLTSQDKLIVTTIQKLNNAISKESYLKMLGNLGSRRIVFIFDECHRSQFGDTHKAILEYFTNCQIFGFTGTPILADNASKNSHGKRTTKDLFGEALHKYVITDAIRDNNVLRFCVEYVGRYKYRDGSANNVDIEVEDIDKRELMDSEARITKIIDYIIANHNRKTHERKFNAIFAVSGVKNVIKYYDLLNKAKSEGRHNLNIATIFSYGVNEDDVDNDGVNKSELDFTMDAHSREKLDSYIRDYNKMYGTNFSTQDSVKFYNYFTDIAKRVKEHATKPQAEQIDILLVANMFLTGFDAKTLNTLYVDKNLRHHGLIQAYSRTNRVLNAVKSQGNVVVFRNLKKATDEALQLFSDKNANEVVFVPEYSAILEKFVAAVSRLREVAPTIDSINGFESESQKLEFIQSFREVLRLKNNLETYADYTNADLSISVQDLEDYQSKYLDMYDSVIKAKEKVSIINDVDFEVELIERNIINVQYILQLLALASQKKGEKRQKEITKIRSIIDSDVNLRSKRELIEKFILENLPSLNDISDMNDEYDKFMDQQKQVELAKLCIDENLDNERLSELISHLVYNGSKPTTDQVISLLDTPPSILKRGSIADRLINRVEDILSKFFDIR